VKQQQSKKELERLDACFGALCKCSHTSTFRYIQVIQLRNSLEKIPRRSQNSLEKYFMHCKKSLEKYFDFAYTMIVTKEGWLC